MASVVRNPRERTTPCAKVVKARGRRPPREEGTRTSILGKEAPGASKPQRPTWMVMGSWLSNAKPRWNLRSRTVFHTFALIVLLTTVSPGSTRRLRHCLVDKCSEDYHSVETASGVSEKCRMLQSHRQCLSDMRVICRGNLLYHTSVHINQKQMKKLDCSSEQATGANDTAEKPNLCSYAGKPKFKFCSLFGDPHVRTFREKFYTCRANGSWPLISNDYLVVKATNTLVNGGREATAISKITVTIEDSGDCAQHKTYTADVGNSLPATFDDNTRHTGMEESVKITETIPGIEVKIEIRFIATTLVIRHVVSHLTFSAKMPEKIVASPVNKRPQMCVKGCPKTQRIHLMDEIERLTVLPKPRNANLSPGAAPMYSEEEARRRCKEALLAESHPTSQRAKRSAGKSHAERGSQSSRRRKDTGLDPSATTWRLLSPGSGSRSNNKNRRRHSTEKRDRPRMISDDPRARPSKRGGGKRGGKNTSKRKRDTNFYFEACVFDLMTTADVMYASSARGAFDDVTRFHRKGSKAPGAALDSVRKWKLPNTTTTTTTTTATQSTTSLPVRTETNRRDDRVREDFSSSTPDSGSTRCGSGVNLLLLAACLFSCKIFDAIQFDLFWRLDNKFFKVSVITT